ncbi:MAG: DUF2314 domain-containing protein, partial [Pseudomonadota bacterium]
MPKLTAVGVDGWELDDGELRHQANPDTYWIPDAKARSSVLPGMFVKLRFYIQITDESEAIFDAGGERMWVEVIDYKKPYYLGKLHNQPV